MQVRIKWKEEKEYLILVKRKKKERKQKNAYSPQAAGGPMKKPPTPAVTVNRHRAAGES